MKIIVAHRYLDDHYNPRLLHLLAGHSYELLSADQMLDPVTGELGWNVENMRREIDCRVIMENCLRVWRAMYGLPGVQRNFTQRHVPRDGTYQGIQSALTFTAMRFELYDRLRRIEHNVRCANIGTGLFSNWDSAPDDSE